VEYVVLCVADLPPPPAIGGPAFSKILCRCIFYFGGEPYATYYSIPSSDYPNRMFCSYIYTVMSHVSAAVGHCSQIHSILLV